MDITKKILLFTDGACSGNPGPGGFGSILVYPEGKIKELGEGRADTTNNRMEMVAVLKGLVEASKTKGDFLILTDSTYVIQGLTKWMFGWKKRGWLTADGKPVVNKDIWQELDKAVQLRQSLGKVDWGYVRGHQGIPGNERCDEIAVAFSKKSYIELYEGPLLKYPYAIYDIPDDTSLPVRKSKSESKKKAAAYSYLSYIGGELQTHKTWSECEARVKGRSGARFKKSSSAEDEKKIIKEWTGK
jgi:ribonuclease HI